MQRIIILALLITTFCGVAAPAQAEEVSLDGAWLGTLRVGGIELRIAFHVTQDDDKFSATMDSLDQGAKGIPVDQVTVQNKKIIFNVKVIAGHYDGVLNDDDETIDGSWTQGGQLFPLNLKRVDQLPDTVRPQDPKPPFPYDDEEVAIENKTAGVKLAGTLTLPRGAGPFPAVVMITGSGAQDRNEELMNHRPFLVIADYLTRRGVAVLRCDDRGVGGSTGDVCAQMVFLQEHARIDAKRIGLIGHSEGGLIAPITASQHDDTAFIVVLAGMGVNGRETVISQQQAMLKKMNISPALLEASNKTDVQTLDMLVNEPNDAAAVAQMQKIEDDMTASLDEVGRAELGALEKKMGMTQEMKMSLRRKMVTPWFRSLMAIDPAVYLKKVKCPVLALNGELDIQVLPELHLPAIEKALKAGGNNHVTLIEFKGLNHLFQTAETGLIGEYARINETFSPKVLKTMGDWIDAQVK